MQEKATRPLRTERRETDWLLYLWMIYRRLPLIALFIFLALGIAGLYIRFMPHLYEATSLVRLRKPNPIVVSPQFGTTPQQAGNGLDLRTATQLVKTYLTAEQALKILRDEKDGLGKRLRPVIREHLKLLKPQEVLGFVAARPYEPDLIRISVRHPLPEVAAALANGMAEAFVQRLNQEARAEASNERQFIESQLKAIERELKRLDNTLAKVHRELKSVDIEEETKTLIESAKTYTAELLMVEAEMQSLNRTLRRLYQKAAREGPVVSVEVLRESPIYAELQRQLLALEVERANLLSRYLPSHPLVQRVETRIRALKDQIARYAKRVVKASETVPNPAYASLRQQILDLEAQRNNLEARRHALLALLRQVRRQMERFPEDRRKIGELKRRLQVMEQAYISLLARLQDAQIREAAKLGNAAIADIATTPLFPVAPAIPRILLLAVLAGLTLGVILALALEMSKTSVETPEEAQYLFGVPVLSVIPRTRAELDAEDLLKLMSSRRQAAENFRSLRANLKFLSRRHPIRCLLVTSATSKEGKSFVATNLAIAYAYTGHKVILVDADFRRPSLHKTFRLEKMVGLAEVLRGEISVTEALQPGPIKNLWLLPAGKSSPTPDESLDSPELERVLMNLKEQADIVLIDTPPLLPVADTTLIAPYTDGVLFVIASGQPSRKALMKVKEQLEMAEARLIGTVMNLVTPKNLRGYYYYYDRDYVYTEGQ